MDTFYLIVLGIAIVLLIILLTYIGIIMASSSSSSMAYPPSASNCPDYWSMTTDMSSCIIPKNGSRNVGTIKYDNTGIPTSLTVANTPGYNVATNSINFSDKGWIAGGVSSMCAHKNWASVNGVVWDGVSEYNSC